jgi:Flp pilus assembly protein TadG
MNTGMIGPKGWGYIACRRPRRTEGQALTEFAIVLPMLLVLGLGIIELGRYAYIAILVGNAARVGAAYGAQSNITSSDTNGIQTAALADFSGAGSGNKNNGLLATALNVTSFPTCSCDNAGTLSPAPTAAYCVPPPAGTNNSAGSCTSSQGHWVVIVNVTASGKFNSLFNYPGIPSSITVSTTSSMRVAQN